MSKRYHNIDEQHDNNPQTNTILDKYYQCQKQRRRMEYYKSMAQQQLTLSQRNNNSIKSELKNVRKQLSWLTNVRKRHLNDIKEKLQRKQQSVHKLQQLRDRTQSIRYRNKKGIEQALYRSKNKKLKKSQEIKKQLQVLKKIKQKNNKQMLALIKSKMQSQENQYVNRYKNYKKKKNNIFINNYQELIKQQQQIIQKSKIQIIQMLEQSKKINNKLQKSKKKLKFINNQICNIKNFQNSSIADFINQRKFKKNICNNIIMKKSSKPQHLLLQDTNQSEIKQTDQCLENN